MSLKRNVPNWERGLRIAAGIALIAGGLLAWRLTPLGLAVAASGVAALVTGFAGVCPVCAIAGRPGVEDRRTRSRQ